MNKEEYNKYTQSRWRTPSYKKELKTYEEERKEERKKIFDGIFRIFDGIFRSVMFLMFLILLLFLSFSCIFVMVGAVKLYGGYFGMLLSVCYIFIIICISIDLSSLYFKQEKKKEE